MPVLTVHSDIKKVFLPSTAHLADDNPEKAWVLIDLRRTTTQDMINIDTEKTSGHNSAIEITDRIKDWNYLAVDNVTKLPITVENVGILDLSDFTYLRSLVNDRDEGPTSLSADEKKV